MRDKAIARAKAPEPKRDSKIRLSQKADISRSAKHHLSQIMSFQRAIGNQAVQRLLHSGAIRANLKISQPNDIWEQEADRIAEQVMHAPAKYGAGESMGQSGEIPMAKPA
jgi:hypothetical protein